MKGTGSQNVHRLGEKLRRDGKSGGHVAGICSGDMLQRQFSSCDIPVLRN